MRISAGRCAAGLLFSAFLWARAAAAAPQPEALADRAWRYLRKGSPQKAIRLLAEKEPAAVTDRALLALGWSYLKAGRFEDAGRALQACARSQHMAAAAQIILARVLSEQGKLSEALQAYRRAKTADYALSEADLWSAQLQERLGDLDSAWGLYERLSRVDPKWKDVASKSRELQPRLSKRPQEISPSKRIAAPSPVRPLPAPGRALRIGIHTDSRGDPIPVQELSFRAGSPFSIRGKDSGRVLAKGRALERWTLRAGTGLSFGTSARSGRVRTQEAVWIELHSASATLVIEDLQHASGYAWARRQDQEYRGKMEVAANGGGLRLVNAVALEEYLLSVLPSEMIAWWPEEALKCQALISRTNALYKSQVERRHRNNPFHLCDSQHCQAYTGAKAETAKVRSVVEATAGEALYFNGRLLHALFSSNCGGAVQASGELAGWGRVPYLQNVSDARPGQAPPRLRADLERWLRGVPDIYCGPSAETHFPESRWVRIISQDILTERVNRFQPVGKVTALEVLARSPSGHVRELLVRGEKASWTLEKEHHIRGTLAPGLMRSTLFVADFVPGDGSGPGDFVFWGGGWGHGVGLCQSGAAGRAKAGQDYRAILKAYYPGAEILRP